MLATFLNTSKGKMYENEEKKTVFPMYFYSYDSKSSFTKWCL